jgi:hypothetical protein
MIANTIHTNTFTDPVNTVKVWKEALHHIQTHAKELGINDEVRDILRISLSVRNLPVTGRKIWLH